MSDPATYTPPAVWQWQQANGGRFANINRPVSGATHERELPVGRHPLQLYSLGTPINEGQQFGSGFVGANPNSKIPALMDHSLAKPRRVFESGAILLYLAEKFDAFLSHDPDARTETLNWLFWQMGSAPYLGGGFGHFYAYAPTRIEYAIDRFTMETKRQMDVLDQHLAQHEFMAGADYSIADIAIWPWYGALAKGLLYEAGEFLQVQSYRHLNRWADQILARPAVRRGRMVNRVMGDPASQLHERHEASDFDTRTQDKLAPAKA